MKQICYHNLVVMIVILFHHPLYAQNVGIGNSNPHEKLDVSGNIAADTFKGIGIKLIADAGTGKVLTSDEQGNGMWQDLTMQNDPTDDGNIGYGVWGDCQTNGNISEYQPAADPDGQTFDFFGNSVSISGDYAIVGAPGDVGEFNNQGSASIFHFNGVTWEFAQKITDPVPDDGDFFGSCVSISGDYAVIGSPSDDENSSYQGSVSIFHFDGASWVFMQKLLDPDGAINDAFGSSVAISGEKLIVGAPFDNGTFTDQGSATLFHFDGTEWEYITKLLDSSANENDRFGHSVAIDGNTAIVGSVFYDVNGHADEGSVLVFDFDGNTWTFIARLTDPNGTAYDYLGTSVSISGDYVIAGAKGDDDNRGAALIFKKYNQTWGHYKRVYSQGAGSSTYFGASVGISGDNLLIGANGYSYTGCNGCGSAILYQRVETVWQRYQQINDPGGAHSDQMGISVAIDGITRRFIIGAFGTDGFKGKVLLGKIN